MLRARHPAGRLAGHFSGEISCCCKLFYEVRELCLTPCSFLCGDGSAEYTCKGDPYQQSDKRLNSA